MKQVEEILIAGVAQQVELATVTVGTMEQIELAGKKGLGFNIALVAASIKTTGDENRGTEEFVRSLPFFPETAGEEMSAFHKLLRAATEVNGMKVVVPGKKPLGEEAPSVAAIQ